MKRNNHKLIILVSILLVGIGISLAYFVSSTKINGSGALVDVTTSEINGAEVKVEGILQFDDSNIYPGHKNISGVKVTSTGDNELIPYNLIWNGTNTINTPLNYTVYKTSSLVSTTTSCTKRTNIVSGMQQLSEECNISNLDLLGSPISSGTINKDDTKVILVSDEFITAISTGDIKYYYIVLEYPNLDIEQNSDINGILNGKIKAEESNTRPDINIIAAYVKQDDGKYKQAEDIPQSGYMLNTSKSTCSNGASVRWSNKELITSNLTKSGTSCYLYFDKQILAVDTILANVTVNEGTPDFSTIATTDEGVYATSDGMYNGTTYYWRGAVENNYIQFAGYCWRIIRINGDKTIRLIYDGSSCHANGTSTEDSIAVSGVAYNSSNNQSNYVGWTYTGTSQRTLSGTASNAKTQTEKWYTNNLASYADKIADGKYCNDRDIASGYTWAISPSSAFHYAVTSRLSTPNPTFSCTNSGDIYTLKVGLITADEVIFAGGENENNTSYYLYNGQYYWTMSPDCWNGKNALMKVVDQSGGRSIGSVDGFIYGLRPVINLKSDVVFSSGNGLKDSPYIVAD